MGDSLASWSSGSAHTSTDLSMSGELDSVEVPAVPTLLFDIRHSTFHPGISTCSLIISSNVSRRRIRCGRPFSINTSAGRGRRL